MPEAKTKKPRKATKSAPTIASACGAAVRLATAIETLPVFQQKGVSLSEWLFLSALQANPQMKAGAIGKRLGHTPQRATQLVKALVKGGFLESRPSSTDPRKKDLTITTAGSNAAAHINAEITKKLAAVTTAKPRAG